MAGGAVARRFGGKWSLALRTAPWALLAVGLKFGLHALGWEIISLSPLFSGLLAATVFLLGFMITGVLSDYKESEKIPGEIASGLEAMADELWVLSRSKAVPEAGIGLGKVLGLADAVIDWFYGRLPTPGLHDRLNDISSSYPALEAGGMPANYLARMRQEQAGLRRLVIRVQVIRETNFVASGYAIAQLMAGLLVAGLLLARIEPMREGHFFVGLITFLVVYLIRLIGDLDDPFEYESGAGGPDEVSLQPIEEARERLRQRAQTAR
jgi:hypothetical protein